MRCIIVLVFASIIYVRCLSGADAVPVMTDQEYVMLEAECQNFRHAWSGLYSPREARNRKNALPVLVRSGSEPIVQASRQDAVGVNMPDSGKLERVDVNEITSHFIFERFLTYRHNIVLDDQSRSLRKKIDGLKFYEGAAMVSFGALMISAKPLVLAVSKIGLGTFACAAVALPVGALFLVRKVIHAAVAWEVEEKTFALENSINSYEKLCRSYRLIDTMWVVLNAMYQVRVGTVVREGCQDDTVERAIQNITVQLSSLEKLSKELQYGIARCDDLAKGALKKSDFDAKKFGADIAVLLDQRYVKAPSSIAGPRGNSFLASSSSLTALLSGQLDFPACEPRAKKKKIKKRALPVKNNSPADTCKACNNIGIVASSSWWSRNPAPCTQCQSISRETRK